jgi:hypothetical protein
MARRRHPRHRGGRLESRTADRRSPPSLAGPGSRAVCSRPGLGSRRRPHGRHVELELGDLMVAGRRRPRSCRDPAAAKWSCARLASRHRDGTSRSPAVTRFVGRLTRSPFPRNPFARRSWTGRGLSGQTAPLHLSMRARLFANEAGGARLLASSSREAARSCGRSFYRDAVAYSGTLTRCSVSVAGALRACRNPRIARIPRSSPAITIATPAHRAIVATVHQP